MTIIVRDVVTVPPSSNERPLARINHLIDAGDGSGRLFVNDMNGKIYVIKDEKILPVPFIDIAVARKGALLTEEFEHGVNCFAFHPDFAKPGRPGFGKLYTSSTEIPASGKPDFPSPDPTGRVSHHDVLTEWTVDPGDPNRVDPASRREVLRFAHPLHDHVMGQLSFARHARESDPDYGMLYIGVGDGGNTTFQYNNKVDAMGNAQNRGVPFGKILRINPLADGNRKYSVPPDNPFFNDASYMKEIWALGLRNPQRFSWDTEGTHMMLIADIGQAQVEEIDVGRAGANYGWGEREGTFVVDHADENHLTDVSHGDERFGYTYPAIQYRHDIGKAVTGGFVYRGKAIPQLQGKYIFGDIASGRIFFAEAATLANGRLSPFAEIKLRYLGRTRSLLEILDDARADLRFGIDQGGEMYLLTKRDGVIRKLSIFAGDSGG